MSGLSKLDIVGLLQEHGAIVNGHFQLPNGLHSQTYVQTALVLQYPHLAQKIAKAMSSKFPQDVDTTMSPAMGAVVIGQEVARVKKSRAIFTERVGGAMALRRDFRIERGERILIVEDVLTTGRSTSEVVHLAHAYGAKVIGVAAIVDRSTEPLPLSVPVRALISYPLQVFPPNACPLCAHQVPLSVPGAQPQGPSKE
jgi:orotate phosphoribosyltransferase